MNLKIMIKKGLRPFQPQFRRLGNAQDPLLEEMPDSPILFKVYRTYLAAGFKRVPGGWEMNGSFYPDYLTVGGNMHAIKRTALKYCIGNGLDIGASHWPLPGSTPIDIESGPGLENKIEDIIPTSQDYIFSSHCLEHISEWKLVLDFWISKLKRGGILFLYLPHESCYLWNKENPLMKESHKWTPTPEIIEHYLLEKGMLVVDKDAGPDHFQSFFVCAQVKY